MTRYPTPEEYTKAVQRADCFTADELRGLELVVHPVYGIPMPAAGTSAVVFKAVADGRPQALRFFTRDDVSSSGRYGALREHFTSTGLEDVVALPRWVDGGIRVNGGEWWTAVEAAPRVPAPNEQPVHKWPTRALVATVLVGSLVVLLGSGSVEAVVLGVAVVLGAVVGLVAHKIGRRVSGGRVRNPPRPRR